MDKKKINNNLSTMLKEYRKKNKLTQKQFSQIVNIDLKYYQKIESPNVIIKSTLKILNKIANAIEKSELKLLLKIIQ